MIGAEDAGDDQARAVAAEEHRPQVPARPGCSARLTPTASARKSRAAGHATSPGPVAVGTVAAHQENRTSGLLEVGREGVEPPQLSRRFYRYRCCSVGSHRGLG